MPVVLKNIDKIVNSSGDEMVITAGGGSGGGSGSNSVSYVATGAISSGDIVALRSDGNVEIVEQTSVASNWTKGTEYLHLAGNSSSSRQFWMPDIAYDPNTGIVAVACMSSLDVSSSGTKQLRIDTFRIINGRLNQEGSWTAGGSPYWNRLEYCAKEQVWLWVYGTGGVIYARAFTVNSSGVVNMGGAVTVTTLGDDEIALCHAYDEYYGWAAIDNQFGYGDLYGGVLRVNGLTVTNDLFTSTGINAGTNKIQGSMTPPSITWVGENLNFYIGGGYASMSYLGILMGFGFVNNSVNGTAFEASAIRPGNQNTDKVYVCWSQASNKLLVLEDRNNAMNARIATINGFTEAWAGSWVPCARFYDAQSTRLQLKDANTVLVSGRVGSGGFTQEIDISGNDPVVGTAYEWGSDVSRGNAEYIPSTNQIIAAWCAQNENNSGKHSVSVMGGTAISTNADDWIGVAADTAADGASVPVTITGVATTAQSNLVAGTDYYVADDGTLTSSNTGIGRGIGKSFSNNTILMNN